MMPLTNRGRPPEMLLAFFLCLVSCGAPQSTEERAGAHEQSSASRSGCPVSEEDGLAYCLSTLSVDDDYRVARDALRHSSRCYNTMLNRPGCMNREGVLHRIVQRSPQCSALESDRACTHLADVLYAASPRRWRAMSIEDEERAGLPWLREVLDRYCICDPGEGGDLQPRRTGRGD